MVIQNKPLMLDYDTDINRGFHYIHLLAKLYQNDYSDVFFIPRNAVVTSIKDASHTRVSNEIIYPFTFKQRWIRRLQFKNPYYSRIIYLDK